MACEESAVTFRESREWEVIKAIVTHPKVYPAVSDDFSPPAEKWEPIQANVAHYLLVWDQGELLGLWAFYERSPITWEVHTCLLPLSYGKRAQEAASEMATWIWVNTRCLRLVTEVPDYNRLALRFARAAGMVEYGFNEKSYMKNGHLCGIHLLGMSKPEEMN